MGKMKNNGMFSHAEVDRLDSPHKSDGLVTFPVIVVGCLLSPCVIPLLLFLLVKGGPFVIFACLAGVFVYFFPSHIWPHVKSTPLYFNWQYRAAKAKIKKDQKDKLRLVKQQVLNSKELTKSLLRQEQVKEIAVLWDRENIDKRAIQEAQSKMESVLLQAKLATIISRLHEARCPFCKWKIRFKPRKERVKIKCPNPDCGHYLRLPDGNDLLVRKNSKQNEKPEKSKSSRLAE